MTREKDIFDEMDPGARAAAAEWMEQQLSVSTHLLQRLASARERVKARHRGEQRVFEEDLVQRAKISHVVPITEFGAESRLLVGAGEVLSVNRNVQGNVVVKYAEDGEELWNICLSPAEARWLREAFAKTGY